MNVYKSSKLGLYRRIKTSGSWPRVIKNLDPLLPMAKTLGLYPP